MLLILVMYVEVGAAVLKVTDLNLDSLGSTHTGIYMSWCREEGHPAKIAPVCQ